MDGRSLCVAAVQMLSENGQCEANLDHASRLVQQASQAAAKLIVLPELFSGGYWLTEQAWETAEPQDGPTEVWLRETARRHAIWLGGSYLQARGEDFFNVFALATPNGDIAGRVPKQKAASVEAYLFRGQRSPHIIATEFGRVGVGICYDNAFRYIADAFIEGDADIAVMPFSAPTPQRTWYYGRRQAEAFRASYRHGAQNYARMLGIPAVQVNKSGRWKSALPAFFPAQDSKYDGQSEIADSNGKIIAELGDEEAVIVGEVTLDPALKNHALGKEHLRHGRWIAPVPLEFKLYRFVEAMGARSYRRNPRRRTQAMAVSTRDCRKSSLLRKSS
jgi:N-carbamoylputrescine amidase